MSQNDRRAFIGSALGALLIPAVGLGAGFQGGVKETLGPNFGPGRQGRNPPNRSGAATDLNSALQRWNKIAVDATGLDHTPVAAGEQRVFGEQLGPCRSSRAMAIVHLAMYDAAATIVGRLRDARSVAARGASVQAAIAQSAHDTLIALFPSQTVEMDTLLAEDVTAANDAKALRLGVQIGRHSAAAILLSRMGDGSEVPEPHVNVDYLTSDLPGHWRQDPISKGPLALGAYWGNVRPFLLHSGDQFRAPAPALLASSEYALAYQEVQQLGGDGITTPTQRTAEQTIIGTYWAYDGTPSLCAPPRLYNQVAMTIANQRKTSGMALMRLMKLINVNMADAAIAIWDSKYFHDFWRPVTGVREGAGDGNSATAGDLAFTPLGAPASNLTGPNFTPPFPSYPSGHAGFGGALFQTLRRFYGTDDIAFSFVSDEYNGVTQDRGGNTRPLLTRNFPSLSSAEEENGQSRIYLGIHWAFDKTSAIAMGRQVANHNFDKVRGFV